jgi:hypothetical protein
MFVVPFDLERMETRGTAVAVLDDVAYDPIAIVAQYDVSSTGTLVYRRHVGFEVSVQYLDVTGKQMLLRPDPLRTWGFLACLPMASASPDHSGWQQQDIWVTNRA